jgi:uncharacterized protein
MKVAVVSDTHGHVRNTLLAIERISGEGVDVVLHCGDVGSAGILPLFSEWPLHFVLGNVDHDVASLRLAAREFGQSCHDRFADLDLEGVRIAMLHGDDGRRLRETVEGQEYDLVCYGHTHCREHHREGTTTVLNPGALYRARPHTLAIVELPGIDVRIIELET